MASKAGQGVVRSAYTLARSISKPTSLSKKFEYPFSFEKVGASNILNSFTTHTIAPTASRTVSQQTSTPATEVSQKSAYATVASPDQSTHVMSSKFRIPFDEGAPMKSTLDNIVEQVESIPKNVQSERGYHIIGKLRASEDRLRNILAVGDMRIWQ